MRLGVTRENQNKQKKKESQNKKPDGFSTRLKIVNLSPEGPLSAHQAL